MLKSPVVYLIDDLVDTQAPLFWAAQALKEATVPRWLWLTVRTVFIGAGGEYRKNSVLDLSWLWVQYCSAT